MRCIFQLQRCMFQLVRCIIPIWRPPDISGGHHLENEMYIYFKWKDVYFNWRDIYFKYISPVEIYIFSLKIYISFCKWRPPDISGARQIEIYISLVETYISFSKWRPPDRNNISQQLKYTGTSLLMIICDQPQELDQVVEHIKFFLIISIKYIHIRVSFSQILEPRSNY